MSALFFLRIRGIISFMNCVIGFNERIQPLIRGIIEGNNMDPSQNYIRFSEISEFHSSNIRSAFTRQEIRDKPKRVKSIANCLPDKMSDTRAVKFGFYSPAARSRLCQNTNIRINNAAASILNRDFQHADLGKLVRLFSK